MRSFRRVLTKGYDGEHRHARTVRNQKRLTAARK